MPDPSRAVRVLAVTYGLPWPLTEGAKIRDFHLLRELARDAEVSLLAFCKDDRDATDASELKRFCANVETWVPPRRIGLGAVADHLLSRRPLATLPFYCAEFARLIATGVERWRPTSVQIEHSFLAPYAKALPGDCRKVLSLHNIGERQYESMARIAGSGPVAALKARAMRGWEAAWTRDFDACVTVSADEAAWIRYRAPGLPVWVIDNGVACDVLRPLPAAGGNDILFIGVLGYPPNADAVVQFALHAMPVIRSSVPDARFVVVGRNPRSEVRALAERGLIELHEDVPQVLPFYQRARVSVVPLRAGGGTRLKILEAMALGRPVVSTPVGCEGLDVTNEQQLLITGDPESMAAAVIRILRHPTLGRDLAGRSRTWVEAHHDWALLGERLRQLHRDLASGVRGTAA